MTSRRILRRRLAGLGVLLGVAAAVVVLVVAIGDDGGPEQVPPGGSQFGADGQRSTSGPKGTLIDALAGVLATGSSRETAETRKERRAAGLPLPLPRAVAQLFVVGFEGNGPDTPFLRRLPARGWGAVLVDAGNYDGREAFTALVDAIDAVSRGARHPEPMILAVQQGDPIVTVPGIGPRGQRVLGAEGSAMAARAGAARAGRSLRRFGVDGVLGPVADLAAAGGPAEGRAFGEDPAEVARFVRAAVAGWKSAGIAPIPGRFPGEGAASQDPLEGPSTVGLSLQDLLARDVRPFAGVVGRVPAIELSAASYAAWDGVTPATLLPEAVRLLRRRLGFDGVIVSGDLLAASAQTGNTVGHTAVEALRAGADMLLIPGGRAEQDDAYRAIVSAVRRKALPAARVAEAARRVLAMKRRYGG